MDDAVGEGTLGAVTNDQPTKLDEIYTPALVLDRTKLIANFARMAAHARKVGVRLRPHLKTAKSAEVAKLALVEQARGLTVSTLKEAEYFFENGIDDLLYAVAIPPAKLPRAAALIKRGAKLTLITDDVTCAQAMASQGRALGVTFRVLIELECGDRRCGVAPDGAALLEIAGALAGAGNGAFCAGVITHAGQSYGGRSIDEMKVFAAQEVDVARRAAVRLRSAGHAAGVVSVGSSPTAVHGADFEGITELRCGVYTLGDLFQAGIGTHRLEDIAVSVLATVISRRPERNELMIDAGAMALSKDRSTEKLPPGLDAGFGWLLDEDGETLLHGLRVTAVSQEHGHVGSDTPIDFSEFPIGRRVRVLPNHACLTAAAHEVYHVTDGGREIVALWPRVRGW